MLAKRSSRYADIDDSDRKALTENDYMRKRLAKDRKLYESQVREMANIREDCRKDNDRDPTPKR